MCDNKIPIYINTLGDMEVNPKQFKRMIFIMNALEKGWKVSKNDNQYTFVKKHEGKCEVFEEKYLETFVTDNFNMDVLTTI
jgi:hypothetical protein